MSTSVNICQFMILLYQQFTTPHLNQLWDIWVFISQKISVHEKIFVFGIICKTKSFINFFGISFLTKMETEKIHLSCYTISIPETACKAVIQVNLNFMWKNKACYVKKGNMIKVY